MQFVVQQVLVFFLRVQSVLHQSWTASLPATAPINVDDRSTILPSATLCALIDQTGAREDAISLTVRSCVLGSQYATNLRAWVRSCSRGRWHNVGQHSQSEWQIVSDGINRGVCQSAYFNN